MVISKVSKVKKKFQELIFSNLLLGLFCFLIFNWLITSAFVYGLEKNAESANITSYEEALWWGFVTLFSVGYGDYFPVTLGGRVIACELMITGMMTLAVLTSKISSGLLQRSLREGRGQVNTSELEDHFVVCGWKEEMEELLCHILDFNPDLKATDVVLIANISPSQIESLKEIPRLKGLHFIVGEYFSALNLQRAAPEKARKVLILADKTPGHLGSVPTMTEVDARTIMTAMTLSNIARGTLVAAEILDPKMDHYLKLAQVSEIIYSREYSRLLLSNASGGTGIANIVIDLLDPKTPTILTTKIISESWIGKSYQEFKSEFEKRDSTVIVIGILENTGNAHRIKEQALRQAQKTPDVGMLVDNLRMVKEMKFNHPYFNPPSEYLIQGGSTAIVIETRAFIERGYGLFKKEKPAAS